MEALYLLLDESKYGWGHNQYLEEHIGFNDEDEHIGGVDLYFSVEDNNCYPISEIFETEREAMRLIEFREEDTDYSKANRTAWNRAITVLKSTGVNAGDIEIYEYNQGFSRPRIKFHVVAVRMLEGFVVDENAGLYSVSEYHAARCICLRFSSWDRLGEAWSFWGKWCKKNKQSPVGQWLERCEHADFEPNGQVICILPVEIPAATLQG